MPLKLKGESDYEDVLLQKDTAKQLEGTRSFKVNKKPDELLEEFLEEEKPETIVNTEEESKIIGKVLQRYEKMRSKRTMIDRYWQMFQLQFEANFLPYQDGRSRSNVPLEWAVIELFVSEAMSKKSDVKISAVSESDITKSDIMKRVWDFDRIRYDRDDELYKSEYITAIFGTCPYFNGVETKSRIIQDPEFVNGEIIGIPKVLEESQIVLKTLDVRNVYIDDRVTDYKNANDCVYKEYLTLEDVEQLEMQPGWKNLEAVTTGLKHDQPFWTKEDRAMLQEGQVEFLHYWNKATDNYFVIANRNTLVKQTFIPYAHKGLPITMRQYAHNPMSIYGRGLCEALMNFKSEINTLKEMIMDGIKRSNNSLFAIGAGLDFDGEEFGFNNTTVKFTGALTPENFQELRGQAPNQAIFSYLEMLLRDVAIYVGIDPSGIIGQASSTAFETAVKQESALKRVNVILANRDIALKQVYKKHLSNLMQFFPVITAKQIMDIDPKGKAVRPEQKNVEIPLKDENIVNGQFVKMDGRFSFELKPEDIRGQLDIEVYTNFNAPTLKQLKIERYKEFSANLLQLSQTAQIPGFSEAVPMKKFIEQMAYEFDIDLESIGGLPDSIKNQKEELMNQVLQMAGVAAGGADPTIPEQAAQAFDAGTAKNIAQGDLQSAGIRKNIGGIMTPTTPNINNANPGLKGMVG